METLTKAAWIGLALVHAMPAAVLVAPSLAVLILHRGALFLAIVVAALFAAVDPAVRPAASVMVAVSVLGFLAVHARAGMPAGALRTIALVDLAALLPLAVVAWQAWIVRPAAA